MKRILPLALALACAPAFAAAGQPDQSVIFGVSLGYIHPLTSTTVLVSSGGIYDQTGAGLALNDGGEFGLEFLVIHSERFSTRWGAFATYQGVTASNPPYGTPASGMNRLGFGGYGQINFNLVNGVGKSWYVTVGGVYANYSISANSSNDDGDASGNLDKVSGVGVIAGTGISYNGRHVRFTPEVLVQKIGVETTGIFRLHFQFPF